MSNEEIRMTPRILFQSFMLVAGAYIAHLVLLFIVANVAFPDSMAIITGEPAEFQKIVESEPERVYPESMAWVLMLASSVVCFGLGAAVARLAPISSFSHVLFFAAILFFQFLQLAIGAEPTWRNKLILFMAISPVAALLGANFSGGSNRQSGDQDSD